MVEYKYVKAKTPEGEPQRFEIHRVDEIEHITTTTIAQEEALVAELKTKLEFHEEQLAALKKL